MNILPKQIHIDNGQIGGVITIVLNSMFVFSFLTFINSSILVYDKFLKDYLSPLEAIGLMLIGSFIWFIIYYVVIFPSMMQFGNRQGYMHGNPIREDIEVLQERMTGIEEAIKSMR